MKILLVDDESELVSAMAERLNLRGMDTDWVTCGVDAIEAAKEKCYDIGVLDMKMPRMSGLELKNELSAICPNMKYIFLSGHGSEKDFKEGSAQAACYLIKPVKIEDLIKKINEACDIRR